MNSDELPLIQATGYISPLGMTQDDAARVGKRKKKMTFGFSIPPPKKKGKKK